MLSIDDKAIGLRPTWRPLDTDRLTLSSKGTMLTGRFGHKRAISIFKVQIAVEQTGAACRRHYIS